MSLTEIDVDNFAGGGGASTGIEAATGRPVTIAVNHCRDAIAMHQANHPETRHYIEDVWEVDPREAAGGRRVKRLWLSPDCTFFSRAKGNAPRTSGRRGLAWVAIRWARTARPDVIFLENVEEFEDWGPLQENGKPDKTKKGETFRAFVAALISHGYEVQWRRLVAADYGAPTTRRRLFMIARRDRKPIVWPEATHGEGRAKPRRTAAEIIDWSLPTRSIFGRKKPLADATMRRIAAGLRRYVLESANPFIVPLTHHGNRRAHPMHEPMPTVTAANRGEVTAFLAKHFGGPNGHQTPGQPMTAPTGTITVQDHHALVTAHVETFHGRDAGAPADGPLPTVTTRQHFAEVRAFLVKYYGDSDTQKQPIDRALDVVTTKARFGLVTVAGVDYEIVDIGMRMLQPRELFNAQGFPESYVIDVESNGKPITKTAQIELCGNSVCPDVARAIVGANSFENWRAA